MIKRIKLKEQTNPNAIQFTQKRGKFDFACDIAMPKGINVLGYLKYFHYFGGKFDFAYDMALPKGDKCVGIS